MEPFLPVTADEDSHDTQLVPHTEIKFPEKEVRKNKNNYVKQNVGSRRSNHHHVGV